MSQYRAAEFGRIFILELEDGEDILRNVTALVEKENLKSAVFLAGAGGVDQCRSHFAAKNEAGEYRDYPLEWTGQPYALCGVGGFIEQGRVHLHGVLGNEQESWTVHLHEGCTCMGTFRLAVAELTPGAEG